MRNLARTWAEDLKGTGIRVNVLSPGAVATDLATAALGEEGLKAYGAMTALQRMGDPAEVARGGCLSCVVGQQLHDRQRGRRRRRPGATLTPAPRALPLGQSVHSGQAKAHYERMKE